MPSCGEHPSENAQRTLAFCVCHMVANFFDLECVHGTEFDRDETNKTHSSDSWSLHARSLFSECPKCVPIYRELVIIPQIPKIVLMQRAVFLLTAFLVACTSLAQENCHGSINKKPVYTGKPVFVGKTANGASGYCFIP